MFQVHACPKCIYFEEILLEALGAWRHFHDAWKDQDTNEGKKGRDQTNQSKF